MEICELLHLGVRKDFEFGIVASCIVAILMIDIKAKKNYQSKFFNVRSSLLFLFCYFCSLV